ncbi:MAG: hypothetical protein K2Y21_02500 [Phycisphaerales bacterium]|nr:hypothetical protein [Phycisphaerales bacterium]
MRLLLVILATSQICLGAWVAVQCAWGSAGLAAFSDDVTRLAESVDTPRWKEANPHAPVPTREDVFRSAQGYSGNRFSRLLLVVPFTCLLNAIAMIYLAVVARQMQLNRHE